MTSLIRPTSPLSAIELLGQQLAGPGLQQGLWSGSVSITLCQTGSDPEGEDRGLKRLERHEVKRVKPFKEKDVYRVCSGLMITAATLMTGKPKRLLLLLCGWVSGRATRVGKKGARGRQEGGQAYQRCHQQLPCLDKTHGTCGGDQHEASHLEEKTTKSSPQYNRARLHQV